MRTPTFRPRRVAAAIATLCAFGAGHAYGAGFALQENSGSGLGNAYAAGATLTEDVSGMWSNAATLSKRTRMEAAGALHIITPSIKFKDGGSVAPPFQPLGSDGGNAGDTAAVPNMYIAVPINRQWVFGLGINAPFGLVTEYNSDFMGRYQAIKSDVKTINVNPAISWQATPNFAIGVGANWQRIEAELTNHVNYSGGIAQGAQGLAAAGQITPATAAAIIAATPGLDSKAKVDGDDDAWGWNVGVLWDVSPTTRIGASYRSEIKYNVKGNASFDNPTVTVPPALAPVVGLITNGINTGTLYNGGVTSDITLPAIVNVSFFSQINPQWDIMADLQWTGWSSIKDLTFNRTDGTGVLSSTPENFDDAWRFAVGANYRHNDKWMFRGGIAFDQTPVNTHDRTPRLPDEDRWWISFGAQYKWNANLKFDAGFTYIDSKKATISQNAGNPARYGLLQGNYEAYTTIFSMQATYTF